jgi:thiol-disulfide isomerase/thioredoxin
MKTRQVSLAIISILFTGFSTIAQDVHPEPKTLEIGSQAPDFRLTGVDDKTYSLSDFAKSKVLVVVFNCNHCPTAQAYQDRLIDVYNNYTPKGVALVVISSNSSKSLNLWEQGWSDLGDSFEEMKIRAKDKSSHTCMTEMIKRQPLHMDPWPLHMLLYSINIVNSSMLAVLMNRWKKGKPNYCEMQ